MAVKSSAIRSAPPAAPLIGYAFAAQILSVSDRMMISKMVGNDAVGIYSTLYTVSSISLLVWTAINSSFIPYLYQNIEKKDNRIKELSLALMGSYAIIAVMLTFLAPSISISNITSIPLLSNLLILCLGVP